MAKAEFESATIKPVRAATLIVAASNSSARSKKQADYICSGTADQVDINVALTALPATGGRVILLEGIYDIGAAIVMGSNQQLQGQGRGTKLLASAYINMITATGGSGSEKVGITIADLLLDGGSQTSEDGIAFAYVDFSEIRSVWFESGGCDGVDMDDSDYIRITDCFFDDNLEYAINADDCDHGLMSNCHVLDQYGIKWVNSSWVSIIGNIVETADEAGIYMDTCTDVLIANNILLNPGTYGIAIETSCYRVTVSGNIVTGGSSSGIYLNGVDFSIVSNNIVQDNDYDGIMIWDSHSNVISGNVCESNSQKTDNTYNGIEVNGSDDCVVTGNVIRRGGGDNKQKYGIEIASGCDRTMVYGNNLYDSGSTAPILDAGTNTTFDLSVQSTILDLSGAAADIVVFFAECPCQLVGYSVLYTEASSVDAGVAIRVGRYQDGVALDDDYFDTSTSEASEDMGHSKHFSTSDLTQILIAAGDTVTVGTAGGKGDGGEVIFILQIVRVAS